jgi:hypothetical protein
MPCETLKRSLEITTPQCDTLNPLFDSLNPWMDPKLLLAWVQKKDVEVEQPKKRAKSQASAKFNQSHPKENIDKSRYIRLAIPPLTFASYRYDILKMMHSFGDVALPLQESAEVMERIAKNFLQCFLARISKLLETTPSKKSKKNDKKKLSFEIILKAIDNPEKIQRAQDIITFLNRNKKIENAENEDVDDEDLLASIDVPAFAEEKKSKATTDRLLYRDELAKKMTTEEYLYFTECSKVSFTKPQKRKKFLKWADMESYKIKYNGDSIDLLGYLVYEHLEEIVRKIRDEDPKRVGPIVPSLLEPYVNKNVVLVYIRSCNFKC